MISRPEVEQVGAELGVHTSHVQRDYVFGWLLNGIYAHSALGEDLVLKGGNCLRKAYFPLARYSGDLDFSTAYEMPPDRLVSELNAILSAIHKQTGVDFEQSKTIAQPQRGADDDLKVVKARVYFHDFYGEESSMTISVRLDVAEFDRLYLPVQQRNVIHAYSDRELNACMIRCVKLEEQLASKMKCLLQRRHVADLFDFICGLLFQTDFEVDRREVVATFLRKTIFSRSPGIAKGLLLDLPLGVLQGFWDKYIVCPITSRIDFSRATDVFRGFVDSLFPNTIASYTQGVFFPSKLRNPIMEAAHNQTLLRIRYRGVWRLVEPYSLSYKVRQDHVGREYLYVYDRTGGSSGPGIKCLVSKMVQGIENTQEAFEPRLPIELSKAGEVSGSLHFDANRTARSIREAPRYFVECVVCERRFPRKKPNTKLNPHHDEYGNRCVGRRGRIV